MSSFYYNGDHSITFGKKNTWKDWKLIPAQRPSFAPPLPKNNFMKIPGGNGIIDLSESLTGYPIYQDRTGSWEFIVSDQVTPWQDIYSEIMNYLQGKRFNAVLEDDKYFHYEGRFWVNEERSDPEASKIVIEYDVYPYKREPTSSIEPWLWDPFDFKYGVIRDSGSLKVNGSLSVVIPITEEPVSPKIDSSVDGIKMSHDGKSFTLKKGTNLIPELVFMKKEETLSFSGNGTVSIEYVGGRL